MNATTPLPANATPTMISTTTVVKTTAATTSRAVRPIRASNRPRTLCQASSMVMLEPKTARPTTTVNMPESRIAASTVANAPGGRERGCDHRRGRGRLAPQYPQVSGERQRAVCSSSASTSVITTTIVVSPSVAFGLARMQPTALLKMSPTTAGAAG